MITEYNIMSRNEVPESKAFLSFDEYQRRSQETAIYPGKGTLPGLMYAALGAVNEAGEVAGKVKKMYRDGTPLTLDQSEAILAEVGDALWYLADVAEEAGFTLGEAAAANLDKLASRKARGVLGGSGDNR